MAKSITQNGIVNKKAPVPMILLSLLPSVAVLQPVLPASRSCRLYRSPLPSDDRTCWKPCRDTDNRCQDIRDH